MKSPHLEVANGCCKPTNRAVRDESEEPHSAVSAE